MKFISGKSTSVSLINRMGKSSMVKDKPRIHKSEDFHVTHHHVRISRLLFYEEGNVTVTNIESGSVGL